MMAPGEFRLCVTRLRGWNSRIRSSIYVATATITVLTPLRRRPYVYRRENVDVIERTDYGYGVMRRSLFTLYCTDGRAGRYHLVTPLGDELESLLSVFDWKVVYPDSPRGLVPFTFPRRRQRAQPPQSSAEAK
jgi:hypothetical protein